VFCQICFLIHFLLHQIHHHELILRFLRVCLSQCFFDKIANIIKSENRPLLIFPQGTRVKFEERVPFKKGAGRIYEALNISCVPIALNSGKVWPKIGFIKYPGKITISFLQPIEPGIERETFLEILEKKIYDEMDTIK